MRKSTASGWISAQAGKQLSVPARKGVRIPVPVVTDIRHTAHRLARVDDIIDAQPDYVRLARLICIPEAVRLAEGLAVLRGGHAAAREIIHLTARHTSKMLSPRVFKHIEIYGLSVHCQYGGRNPPVRRQSDFKLAGSKAVPDASDRAENRAHPASDGNRALQRQFVSRGKGIKEIHGWILLCFVYFYIYRDYFCFSFRNHCPNSVCSTPAHSQW